MFLGARAGNLQIVLLFCCRYEKDGELVTIENPAEFPVEHSVSKGIQFMEPMIDGTLVFPERYARQSSSRYSD